MTDFTMTIERLKLVLSELIEQLSSLGERGCGRLGGQFFDSSKFELQLRIIQIEFQTIANVLNCTLTQTYNVDERTGDVEDLKVVLETLLLSRKENLTFDYSTSIVLG